MQENGYFGLKMYATLSLHRILGYISVLGLSYSLVINVLCYFQVKYKQIYQFYSCRIPLYLPWSVGTFTNATINMKVSCINNAYKITYFGFKYSFKPLLEWHKPSVFQRNSQ